MLSSNKLPQTLFPSQFLGNALIGGTSGGLFDVRLDFIISSAPWAALVQRPSYLLLVCIHLSPLESSYLQFSRVDSASTWLFWVPGFLGSRNGFPAKHLIKHEPLFSILQLVKWIAVLFPALKYGVGLWPKNPMLTKSLGWQVL